MFSWSGQMAMLSKFSSDGKFLWSEECSLERDTLGDSLTIFYGVAPFPVTPSWWPGQELGAILELGGHGNSES